jgi:amino acid adenylation domain-containing protein
MSSEQEAKQILVKCHESGIRLFVEREKLRTRSPKGAMTDSLRREITRNKEHLMVLVAPPDPEGLTPRGLAPQGLTQGPLSFSQERLWFLDQFDTSSQAFTLPLFILLKGELSRSALENAVDDLLRRHHALRTVIMDQEGKARQKVTPFETGALEWRDLSGRTDPKADFLTMGRQMMQDRFDLFSGPLSRFRLVRLGQELHGLILVLHHIISDRSSMAILTRDLTRLYKGHLGKKRPLPPVTQFIDYAAEQRKLLDSDTLEEKIQEIADTLSGSPGLLTLPWDHPRPAVQSMRGSTVCFDVPPELSESVGRMGRGLGATPFMTWLSVFGLLLSRLADQEDLVMGCPVSSRTPETEESIGFFVNTLVLRLDTSARLSFRDYLEATRQRVHDSFSLRELPFERLVDRLQPDRSLDRNPLFQAMFVLQALPGPDLELPGLESEFMVPDMGVSEFDLNLTMEPMDGGYRCYLEYSRDLFDPATIRDWTGYFLTLAARAAKNPGFLLKDLSLLTPHQKQILLEEWSGGNQKAPGFSALPWMVGKSCHTHGNRIAIDHAGAGGASGADGTQTTYRELAAMAAKVAGKLAAEGFAQGDIAALLGPVDGAWIAGCLGIMLAGGTFLPLDLRQPDSRLALILEDAQPRIILCGQDQAQRDTGGFTRLILDKIFEEIPIVQAGGVCETTVQPHDPAYIIYTSGSTGRPKGVSVSHRAFAFHAASTAAFFELTPQDRVLQFASPGFDVVLEEIWPTLSVGACITICPGEAKESLESFGRFTADKAVSVANLPAPFWEAWSEHLAQGKHRAPKSLRLLVTGSDCAATRWLAPFHQAAPNCRFINAYGPTEATITATFYDPKQDGSWSDALWLPLGRPMPGVCAYVLDDNLAPVPSGCVGELCLAGPGVALGYLNLPDVSAEVFMDDPFAPGRPLYRTGDRARFLPGPDGRGILHFVGRRDNQIKQRGFRIEPAEIEIVLAAHEAVGRALVVSSTRGLAALVETKEPVDREKLKQYLGRRLPPEMRPDILFRVDQLPQLSGGKPDRLAAAALADQQVLPEKNFEPPRPGPETVLAKVWASVLNHEPIGRQDNFFHLGGDSILSLRAASLARQQGLAVTPKDFFQGQTLRELAQLTQLVQPEALHAYGPEQGEIPLTPILAHLFEQPVALQKNLVMVLPANLSQPVAPKDLEAALTGLFAHHDMLRLCFDGPTQEAGPGKRLVIRPHEQAPDLAKQAVLTPGEPVVLDLANGPLFLALQPSPDKIIFVAHHVCVDPVSWTMLLEDLETALEQIEKGEKVSLPSADITFPAWAKKLQASADTQKERNRLDLWQQICRNTRSLCLEAQSSGVSGKNEPLEGEILLTPESSALGEEILVAALALAVDRVLGRFPWLLDVEGYGRDALPGTDPGRVAGWFTTVTPARIDMAAAMEGADRSFPPAAAALLAGRQAMRGARALGAGHGLLRYLCTDVNVREQMAGLPAGDMLLNYLGALLPQARGRFRPTIGQGADWFEPIAALGMPDTPPTHALELNAMVTQEGLRIGWRRDPDRLGFEPVESLLNLLVQSLEEVQSAGATVFMPAPANFPMAWAQGLDFRSLGRIHREFDAKGLILADLHPITPLQHGMLFHSLLDTESGTYFDQLVYHLDLELPAKPAHFKAAWEYVLSRHPALRSGFFWEGLDQPLQAVARGGFPEWTEHDLRHLDPEGRKNVLENLLAEDRARPFDLARPPLHRLALCRIHGQTWQVIWSNHHLIMDGWSMPQILEEVLLVTDALARNKTPDLNSAPPFSRIAQWLEEQDPKKAAAFWRDEMADFDTPTPLPMADQGKGDLSCRPQTDLVLTRDESLAIEVALRDQGLTLNCLVQGAWALLLSRYGSTRDICFGATTSGRPVDIPDVDHIVGCCIQTVPVRVKIPGDQPAVSWLAQLRDSQPDRESHGHIGLDKITRAADLPPGTPLFDSLVLVQTYPGGNKENQSLARISRVTPIEYSNYSLTLVIAPAPEGLTLSLVFDPARYRQETADQLLVHLQTLMLDLARRPSALVDELEMLTKRELERIHKEWNGLHKEHPFQGGVQELFEQHCDRTPEASAMFYFGEKGTKPKEIRYGELGRRANQLAHALQKKGVKPETYVGLCLPRNEDLLVGILGILKAGGAYLPLDPEYPAERLEFMIEEADPPVTVTYETLLDRLPLGQGRQALCLDRDREELNSFPTSTPPCDSGPDNAAALIYTSGSTGRPKGVIMLHQGFCNLIQLIIPHLELTPDSRVLQFFSPSFDAATWEIFMALGSGAALVMADKQEILPGPPLFSLMERAKITHATLTPSSLAVMPEPKLGDLPHLGCLLTGGEYCDHQLAGLWARGRKYFHGYGPSEITICCCAPHCIDFARPLFIGRALPNMSMYVLDDRLRPCPKGATGEICIGGQGVARGYLKRPGLTQKHFLADPFAGPQAGEARIYRSGDMGRWQENGEIEFAGRIDHQVKVRGYRVEPGEIEKAIAAMPGVDRAVVEANQGPAGIQLLAYVTGTQSLPDTDRIIHNLKQNLPAYMVPAHVMALDKIPLTPNLKIDREALPSPSDLKPKKGQAMPVTGMQVGIADIWKKLLVLDAVGVDDNFFEIGGHSLLTVGLCSRLNKAFGSDLKIAECYEFPTIRLLASRLGDPETQPIPVPSLPAGSSAGSFGSQSEFEPVAIVGMACRFPGVSDLAGFWDMLTQGKQESDNSPQGNIQGIGLFDAQRFDLSDWEAEQMDPQHRLFLEMAWLALENAGMPPRSLSGLLGSNRVGIFAGCGSNQYLKRNLLPAGRTGGEKGFLTQTLNDSDYLASRLAWALDLTGPAINVRTAGATSLVAVDMACRALHNGQCDAALAGGVSLDLSPGRDRITTGGIGIVVLRRLEDALTAGDPIHAVIRGGAVNNDGRDKKDFFAPSARGQAEVMERAWETAGIDPSMAGYVEGHGETGITGKEAGVAGLIKTALCLKHGYFVPGLGSLPRTDAKSPLGLGTIPQPWPDKGGRKLAGIGAFGIGGTNCHLVLEAPPLEVSPLEAMPWRKALVAADHQALKDALEDSSRTVRAQCSRVAFLFTGQGSQYPGMGKELYQMEPIFRRAVDDLAPVLAREIDMDPLVFLKPDTPAETINNTALAQPMMFLMAHGLVELWKHLGVEPAAMMGHSIGELIAACVAGVFTPEQGVRLAAVRGRLMAAMAPGAMVALGLSEKKAAELCRSFKDLGMAAVNGPAQCVVSGPETAISSLEAYCRTKGIQGVRLPTSHAFHSPSMDGAAREFERYVGELTLQPPTIPWISNLDGRFITADRAQDPAYWGKLIQRPVLFEKGLRRQFTQGGTALLEIGPGDILTRLALKHPDRGQTPVVASQAGTGDQVRALADAAARLWEAGIPLNFPAMHDAPLPPRRHLPTVPMALKRYWIEGPGQKG